MTIALWVCAIIASCGAGALLLGLINPTGSSPAEDRMAGAFFTVVGIMLLVAALLMFILLTAIKAWS